MTHRLVAEHVERADAIVDTAQSRAITVTIQAYFSAWVRQVDDARSAAKEAMELCATGLAPIFVAVASEALGVGELSVGNAEAAARALRPAVQSTTEIGFGEPVAVRGLADAIEALVMLNRLDDAEPLIVWVEAAGGSRIVWGHVPLVPGAGDSSSSRHRATPTRLSLRSSRR